MQEHDKNEGHWCSIAEAARICMRPERTIRAWIANHEIKDKYVMVGGKRYHFVDRDEIMEEMRLRGWPAPPQTPVQEETTQSQMQRLEAQIAVLADLVERLRMQVERLEQRADRDADDDRLLYSSK